MGLATQATSNSNKSFSIVLIILSYRMSTWKSKTKISLNSVVKEGVEKASIAKGESLSNKKNINIWGGEVIFLDFLKLDFSLY